MKHLDGWLKGILIGGLLLRSLVFFVAAPQNRDSHWEVILWVAERHEIPKSEQLSQSYHPPLYYLLMAPLARIGGSALVHSASLLFSCVNLGLIYLLVRRRELFPDGGASIIALSLAAFLPQYVMNGHFISNDTLAILIGTLLSGVVYAYVGISAKSMRMLIAMAVLAGLGLLTKGTFALTGVALTLLVMHVELGRGGVSRWLPMRRVALFSAIWLILGCYKYVENLVHLGSPIVHNLDADPEWARSQRGVYKGIRTIIDINPLPLIRQPILNHRDMRESYPQLFFATFWYAHIPDSSFRAGEFGYAWVGSALYIAGIVPAILFVIGGYRALVALLRWLRATADVRKAILAASVILLLSNFVVVMAAGIRYDVWSCFQSRLCFQSMLPMLVLLGEGLSLISRNRAMRITIYSAWAIAIACCLVYFCVEIAVAGELLPKRASKQYTPGTATQAAQLEAIPSARIRAFSISRKSAALIVP